MKKKSTFLILISFLMVARRYIEIGKEKLNFFETHKLLIERITPKGERNDQTINNKSKTAISFIDNEQSPATYGCRIPPTVSE